VRFASLLLAAGVLAACSSQSGDPHSANGIPPAGGKEKRIRELTDPGLPGHETFINTTQSVSGAVVIAVDTYDEQRDGEGTGDVYVQDIGATKETPFAGINLFAPSFSPGNLVVSPGDVLDMRGTYQETLVIPSDTPIVFPAGSMLVQLSQPTASFRYETAVPQPVDIDLADLASFETGRRWVGMLVRVKNVRALKDTFPAETPNGGRVSVDITPGPDRFVFCGPKPATTLVNALHPIEDLKLKAGDTLKSVTGVVLFFCNLQLAPRSAADIER
jgi:hypothetical protein